MVGELVEISYQEIVERFGVEVGDEVVFRYRVVDKCGVYTEYSEFSAFRFTKEAEFQLIV